MKILITGSAGFIGYHLAKHLLKDKKHKIFGLDSLNSYYSLSLKKNRLKELLKFKNFKFFKINLKNKTKITSLFEKNKFDIVIHLAAQAGVRYSVQNPQSYLDNNIISFFNILDLARKFKIKHFIFASTSSVYGDQPKFPTHENCNTDKPLSFYAATKKSNEVLAYSYSNIFKLPCTGLRFFTVYGPYGRPDMAYYKFCNLIKKNKTINVFNKGKHKRSFTYIDDAVSNLFLILKNAKKINTIKTPVLNIGNPKTRTLTEFINILEKKLFKKSKKKFLKRQPGDVLETKAIINFERKKLKLFFNTELEEGIEKFVKWHNSYH